MNDFGLCCGGSELPSTVVHADIGCLCHSSPLAAVVGSDDDGSSVMYVRIHALIWQHCNPVQLLHRSHGFGDECDGIQLMA